MKTFKYLAVVAIVASVSGLTALSYSAQAATSTSDFVAKASEADMFEIQSSKLALDKSQNDNVKQFAQKMVDDHTASSSKLKTTLSSANEDSSQLSTQLNSSHQKIITKLSKESGDDFDKQYVSAQKDAHKDAVKLFKDYSSNGDDAALKGFATQTLPTLQQHLAHVKKLSSSM